MDGANTTCFVKRKNSKNLFCDILPSSTRRKRKEQERKKGGKDEKTIPFKLFQKQRNTFAVVNCLFKLPSSFSHSGLVLKMQKNMNGKN